jgi:hypothetical protein
MIVAARLTEMLVSTYFLRWEMPLLKDIVMRDSMDDEELYISKMMYNNMLRLGTTYTEGSTRTPELEDCTTLKPLEPFEKVRINILKNNNVFASAKGGAEADFQPVTTDDWKEDVTTQRPFLKTTCEASPAAISLFVSIACKYAGDRCRLGYNEVYIPCQIVQPDVNVRDLSSGGASRRPNGTDCYGAGQNSL